MIPLYLHVSGFLSYRDPVDLDFSSFELACISGNNGAGKSSLLDAITWALFGQARKKDDDLIYLGAKAAEVIFDFTYEANTYRIKRYKAKEKATLLEYNILKMGIPYDPGLEVASLAEDSARSSGKKKSAWNSLTETSVRETEKAIQRTLRMDYDTFTNASFFLQGKADQFAQQAPADRKSILGKILGLDEWENYRDRAVEERRNLEDEVTGIDGQLREINGELKEEPARRDNLARLEEQLAQQAKIRQAQMTGLEALRQQAAVLANQQHLIETLEGRLKAASQSRDQLAGVLGQRRAEQQEYHSVLEKAQEIELGYQAWQDARAELEQWDSMAAQFRQYEQRRSAPLLEIETEKTRLNQEASHLRDLRQEILQMEAEIPGLEAARQVAHQAFDVASQQLERRRQVDQERHELLQKQSDARAENPRLRTEMDELKERIDRLSQAEGAVCPLCGQPLSPEDRASLVERLQAQGKSLGERFRQNQASLKEFESQVRGRDQELADLAGADQALRQQGRWVDQSTDRLDQIRQQSEQWQAAGLPNLQALERRLQEGDYAQEARRQLAAVDAELKSIGYDAVAHEATRQAELDGRAMESELRTLEKARAALAPLEREIQDMASHLVQSEEEIHRQQVDYDQVMASYTAAKAQLPDLDQAELEMLNLQELENRLRIEVGAARQKVEVLEVLRRRQKDLVDRRADLTQHIARLKKLETAFGRDGVPALLIEQALPEIEDQANLILDRLSGGTMMVRFATQRDYKDKRREDKKETLDIKISDGAGLRDYELFSGGEAFRVNFAIRLALSRVLARRAGARLQTLVIDEGFGSQDAEGRQRLIEAINLVKSDFSKILVITHLEELKDAFPTRIEVEKVGRSSRVNVV